jgi:hypothetical protein
LHKKLNHVQSRLGIGESIMILIRPSAVDAINFAIPKVSFCKNNAIQFIRNVKRPVKRPSFKCVWPTETIASVLNKRKLVVALTRGLLYPYHQHCGNYHPQNHKGRVEYRHSSK